MSNKCTHKSCENESYSEDVAYCAKHYSEVLESGFKNRIGHRIGSFLWYINDRIKVQDWATVELYAGRMASTGADLLLKTWEKIPGNKSE